MESARKNKREEREREMFTHLKPLIVSTIRWALSSLLLRRFSFFIS